MKAYSFLLSLFLIVTATARGQVLCISCHDQNTPISAPLNDLIVNGSFESHNCSFGDHYCPSSFAYSCDIGQWTCTGGGLNTYAQILDSTWYLVPDGAYAAYFGNWFCNACSPTVDDTSCLIHVDCTLTGIPSGYPVNDPSYGGTAGVSLQQTVSGLTAGNGYALEFWAGGEDAGFFPEDGLFAVDVGFGDTLLINPATDLGSIGRTYVIQFKATSTAHTIKFTNWGHICANCTELVLDNVRLYALSELSPSVPPCMPVITECEGIFMPNAFSPNGDAVNDRFEIRFNNINCVKTFALAIYDRWGRMVFQSADPEVSWDGTFDGEALSIGVFAYYVKGEFNSGETFEEKGNVTLMK